jgi:hypothetical protein
MRNNAGMKEKYSFAGRTGMRMSLKLAIVASGFKHQDLAVEANKCLTPEQHLSELDITKLVTSRKVPTTTQAAALARVLGRSAVELFESEGR